MKLLYSILILAALCITRSFAQIQPYGVVDTADLKMTSCDFEKDANAMLLFNNSTISYGMDGKITIAHHKRLKIFNSNAYKLGELRFEYITNQDAEPISNFKGETINLNDGKIEVEKISKKAIIKQKVDKKRSALIIVFPSIRAGSIIEYTYEEQHYSFGGLPNWYFQGDIPIRYNRCHLDVPKGYTFRRQINTSSNMVINTDSVIAVANIRSLQEEPFMSSYFDNVQHVSFILTSLDGSGKSFNPDTTWTQIGASLLYKSNYAKQLEIKLPKEELLIDSVKNIQPEQKIACLFNKVKKQIECNDEDGVFVRTLSDVWVNKNGNASEINLILCRLLIQAGLNANLMAVGTSVINRVSPQNVGFKYLNRAIVFVAIDTKKYFILDASNTSNVWNRIPMDFLNTYGLYIDVKNPAAGLVFIEDDVPAKEVSFINAEVSADGKISGTCQINSFGYNRIAKKLLYTLMGEKGYTDILQGDDNNLKINSFKITNLEKDSLPVAETIGFNLLHSSADDNYIYINPNILTSLNQNPFLKDTRYSDIDLTYKRSYSIGGSYKEPQGYKADAMPANVSLVMPDGSITFKRIAEEQNGHVMIRYTIQYNKSFFKKEEYPSIHDFYKKMYEMLNEQIVLKKI